MNKKIKIFLPVLIGFILLGVCIHYLQHTNIPVLEPKGPVGIKERNLIFFGLGLSLVVVIPVYALLFSFAWRYRESNKSAKYSPDLDGSRIAETIWWLIPAVLIGILSVVAWNSSHQLDPYKPLASKNPTMTIQVVAMDWKWLFIYPQQHIASVNLVQFPTNTPVDFEITSDSVMNSFWIPQLGGQIYAMPGMSTNLNLMANQQGDYRGLSANISGAGFAGMNFVARSSSDQSFNSWVSALQEAHSRLSLPAYNQLDQPSQNNPVSYYTSPQTGLYGTILAKYNGPGGSMAGMDMQ